MTTHYLLKGYDRQAVLVSPENAPDGRAIMLGDLIAFEWADPGEVLLSRRVGWSHSLGPGQRALGIHPSQEGFRECYPDPFPRAENRASDEAAGRSAHSMTPSGSPTGRPAPQLANAAWRRPTPFRSKFEDGERDVRRLYPAEFVERVRGYLAGDDPAEGGGPAAAL